VEEVRSRLRATLAKKTKHPLHTELGLTRIEADSQTATNIREKDTNHSAIYIVEPEPSTLQDG
jgi:flagellar basal body-associated protein FliL